MMNGMENIGPPRVARSVLVTGASSGIGASVATSLAASGFVVIATGRDSNRLQEVTSHLPGEGHISLRGDLREDSFIDEMENLLRDRTDLYGLVHCAGVQTVKPLRSCKSVDFREAYEIHVVVPAELMRRMSRHMGTTSKGSFVLLSSVAAYRGGAGVSAYAAAKAAVIALVRAVALELSAQQIRVNALVPGMVATPMSDRLLRKLPATNQHLIESEHPLGIGKPESVAEAAVFLLGNESSWITGAALPVDGGFLSK